MKSLLNVVCLSTGIVAMSSVAALAEGCNWGHSAKVQDQLAAVADDSQVLSTGQISVAQVDCTASPDAPECAVQSAPVTN